MTATATVTGAQGDLECAFDWGDGQRTPSSGYQRGRTASHAYSTLYGKTVTVTALEDTDGDTVGDFMYVSGKDLVVKKEEKD